jgi:plastocyanin
MVETSYRNKRVRVAPVLGSIVAVLTVSFIYNAAAMAPPPSVRVQVGGGVVGNPLFGYVPQNVEIKAGETVLWYERPFVPGEPHTVSFVFDNNTMINGFLAGNPRVYYPAIIDSDGVTTTYTPDASLVITGTEKYVNSGWMFPNSAVPGTSSTFSVTFKKPGTYNYLCLLHPWMVGKVVVA